MRAFARSALAIAFLFAGTPELLAQAQLEWSTLFGNPPLGVAHMAMNAVVDAQGNVFVAVRSGHSNGIYDLDVVKYDSSGALVWSRRFDTGAGASELAGGIALASNGDVCIAGWRSRDQSDLLAVRYDSTGTLVHGIIFAGAPGLGFDGASAVAIDAQDDMVVAGLVTDAQGNVATLVQCYSPLGILLWEARNDLSPGDYEAFDSLVIDPSGDIYAAGWLGFGADRDAVIAKFSANGTPQWQRVFPGSSTVQETFAVLACHPGGGVIVGGNQARDLTMGVWSSNGWVVRCDGGGNFLWSDVYPRGTTYNVMSAVLADESGVSWALHLADISASPHIEVTRISPTGVHLSTVSVPGLQGGLALGNAGQVFMSVEEPGGLQGNIPSLTQFDSSGSLVWRRAYGTPGLTVAPIGIQTAPSSRVVLNGYSNPVNTPGTSALVMQIDVSESPHAYCTGKVNSLGCAPRTVFTGMPRVSASAGFVMRVENVLNQKPGLFLYSITGAAATPFSGGTLCVSSPIRRTSSVLSGGAPGPVHDCSGVALIDMNAFAHGALGGSPVPELLIAGTNVFLQAWGRDNGFAAPNNASLSSGLTYAILP